MERRSAIRTAVVWDALQPVLHSRSHGVDAPRQHVVDLGGGTGRLAVQVAGLGHRVTVVDPSPDALASLERRVGEVGLDESVRGVLGDASDLLDVVGPGSADVVICHGVLEVVDSPIQALEAAAAVLVGNGTLSVLAAQRSAAVFTRALAGHLAEAHALLDEPGNNWDTSDPLPRRFSQEELRELVRRAGFTVTAVRGIRVFTDHISSTLVDAESGAADELQALESAVATSADFMAMATQLHLLATVD
ncbi:MAG TPA: methyltransferase domain-containing protein [Nocardioidaceae bacterium]|nr:methyltransferase domain-containing protein [Nocardioidaceae bacterium]